MKAIILKPIMWNTNNYIIPSGVPSSSGYPHDYGFGHEEWNNNPAREWRGYKLFHTEVPAGLLEYSASGELGIVTMASFEGKHYAISIAVNVYFNDPEERALICEELDIYQAWKEIWQLEQVKKKFDHDQAKFLEFWNEDHEWIAWKCPKGLYHHFDEPILLSPEKISGKSRLSTRYSTYQPIFPEQAIDIIRNDIPEDHPITKWLLSPDFDQDTISPQLRKFREGKRMPVSRKRVQTNSPAERKFEYWVKGDRIVEPLHARLQAKYIAYLEAMECPYKENKDFIDVQYLRGDELVFAEIKPTKNVDTKYAIRAAIGQLLEYQYLQNKDAHLEIVLGSVPTEEEIDFVLSLGMSLSYFDDEKKTFTHLAGSA